MPSRRASSSASSAKPKKDGPKSDDKDKALPSTSEDSTAASSSANSSAKKESAMPMGQALSVQAGREARRSQEMSEGSIEELLAEQMVAVERALAFNQAIAQRLMTERIARMEAEEKADGQPDSPISPTRRKRTVQFSSEQSDAMNQPLLSDFAGVVAAAEDEKGCQDKSTPTHLSDNLFPTLGGVKQLVVDCLSKPSYRVEDHYKPSGVWSWLAQHPWFNNLTLLVIVFNTLWIAIDTDLNHAEVLAEADTVFKFADNFFCTYFTFEMLVRFMAFERKMVALQDPWFVFDGFLVALMIWETWVMTFLYSVVGFQPHGGNASAASVLRIFRIFRLTRVARTARLLSSVPELMILAKGMLIAMRSVMAILCLLALIIYIFSIVFTQLLASSPTLDADTKVKFATVPASANFLLLQVLCGFDADFAEDLLHESRLCYVLFLLYLLFGSLTIMNMLIGILCDVVGTVAEVEKDEQFEREMQLKVESLAARLDVQGRGCVCRSDFEQVIKEPEVILSLTELGVDVVGLMDFAFFVFGENEELSYTNFLHMVVQFRGAKQATVKDVMDMRKQMSMQLGKILEAYDSSKKQALYLQQRLDSLNFRFDANAIGTYPKPDGEADAENNNTSGEYCGTQ